MSFGRDVSSIAAYSARLVSKRTFTFRTYVEMSSTGSSRRTSSSNRFIYSDMLDVTCPNLPDWKNARAHLVGSVAQT